MITLRITRRSRVGGAPISLRFDAATLSDLGKLTAGSILDNIRAQKQADGSSLKANAPSTREVKRRMGLPPLSLVFKQHRFVKGNGVSWSATVDERGNRVSVKPSNPELANLSRSLQQRGYLGWFGVSLKAREAMRARVRKFIRDAIRAATAKRRTERK